MRSVRWRKVARDLWVSRGRVLMMVLAVAVSLAAVETTLGAYTVLTREMTRDYLATNPAAATLELDAVEAEVLAIARSSPGISDAEARETLMARARVGDDWRPLLLFVVDDFSRLRINTFRPESGAWPPPAGTLLVERQALRMLGAREGSSVLVKTPNGTAREVTISGVTHDPGLAPAPQERMGYGYLTRETLRLLGEDGILRELRVTLSDHNADSPAVESIARDLARSLAAAGRPVHELRVPPPRMHPHQRQMTTLMLMLLFFGATALVLSGVVVASSLSAMLARQVREIGIMKTLGVRTGQLAALFASLVVVIGIAAVLLAIPLGYVGAQVQSTAVAKLLNFSLESRAIPAWVFALVALAGVLGPLAIAAVPIRRASRTTIREALNAFETAPIQRSGPRWAWLSWLDRTTLLAVRNAFRRRLRLGLALVLLASGGALFITALSLSKGWELNLAKVYATRHYDVEVRFHTPQPIDETRRVLALPGVKTIEGWGFSRAAFAQPGEVDVVRTYPDGGHGSLVVMGLPPATPLIGFPLLAGRWLREDDTDAVVLNQVALAQQPRLRPGDDVLLSIDGTQSHWKLAGVVEEVGSPGVAYVTDAAFERVTNAGGRARLWRIATDSITPESRQAAIRLIEKALTNASLPVDLVIPLAELRTAMGDHMSILVTTLIAMALVLALVGGLGLGSMMGIGVLERTREIGVMKAVGATPSLIRRVISTEAVVVSILSWPLAVLLAVPLSAWLGNLVGSLSFRTPLPFVLSLPAALGWLVFVLVVAVVASIVPARGAAAITIREALAHT